MMILDKRVAAMILDKRVAAIILDDALQYVIASDSVHADRRWYKAPYDVFAIV